MRSWSTCWAAPDEIAALGDRARRHVLDNFVGDRHLEGVRVSLIEWLGT